ncbi:LysR family transcriptional regulator [Sphingomonas histidinilytica]|uniref:LysR family transcriptional regulator n=1 Tax=Rhizorhabdus histidinilytica TaxID=439228 RepID=UPI001AD9DAF8|nr:LysR family transcriptional regulator [Rhizorhabdus histidinilytica]MBO9376651.1 LysR family transcriptional regulator [Rhizorhabdus histidinilytica]
MARIAKTAPIGANDENDLGALHARRIAAVDDDNRSIDVEFLLFFNAVSENLSFTKAAKALSIDQSWLSHKIRQFEALLGFNLFIRNTRHVELTAAGRALLDPVRRLANVVDQARDAANALRDSMSGVLRVGALPFSFPDPQRTRLIDRFIATHEGIQLNVTSGPTPALLDHLRAGRIDLAFVSAPFEEAGLDRLLLRENRFSMMVPRTHDLARAGVIGTEDVKGVRVILPAQQFSPAAFELYYEPLVNAGAVPVPIPEFQSAPSYARSWELPVVCTQFAAERYDTQDFVVRPINFIPPCRKYLVRLADHRTPPQNLMWDLALASLETKAAAVA